MKTKAYHITVQKNNFRRQKMKDLKGIIAVLITPFDKDDRVDYKGLESNVEWLISQGVHGLLPTGSTGEFASLSMDERKKIAECVIKAADGRVPVAIGTTHETQKNVIELSQHAEKLGAAGVMVSPPPYCKPDGEQIYHYYKDINDAISIPIMIYNNPWTTGVDISEAELIKLFEDLENVHYLKDSTNTVQRARDVQAYGPDKVKVLCGWEDLAYESFVMGAQGWISVAANVVPKLCVDLYEETVVKKDYAKGREAYDRLMPVLRYLENCGKLVQGTKTMANMLGLAGGFMRRPRLPLSANEELEVKELLIGMGVLSE
jgi:4-hydroxy-tetrahydrodipicolinate synthase